MTKNPTASGTHGGTFEARSQESEVMNMSLRECVRLLIPQLVLDVKLFWARLQHRWCVGRRERAARREWRRILASNREIFLN